MFAVFIPGKHPYVDSVLHDVGAGWALDPSVTAMHLDVVENGPDGGAGRLVYFDSPRGRIRNQITQVDLQRQTWLPAAKDGEAAEGRYWLGVVTDAQIPPEALQRSDLTDGLPLQLQDGNSWVIPIADKIPKQLKLNRSTGEEEKRPFAKDRDFIDRTDEIFRYLIGGEFHRRVEEEDRVYIPDGLRFASLALQRNYRVNFDLVDLLGLIGEVEAIQIAAIATGLEPLTSLDAATVDSLSRAPSVAVRGS